MHTDNLHKAFDVFSARLLDSAYKRLEEFVSAENKPAAEAALAALKAEVKEEILQKKAGKGRRGREKKADGSKRAPSAYNLFYKAKMSERKKDGTKQPDLMVQIAKEWQVEKARLEAVAASAAK